MDSNERNMIEGRYGIAKRRYGMGRVLAYLPETAQTQVALQILCINMDTWLRYFVHFIFCLFKPLLSTDNQKIYSVYSPA
jgi:hypothetical protein